MFSGHVDHLAGGEDATRAGGRVGEEGQVGAGVRGEGGREVEQEAGGHLWCRVFTHICGFTVPGQALKGGGRGESCICKTWPQKKIIKRLLQPAKNPGSMSGLFSFDSVPRHEAGGKEDGSEGGPDVLGPIGPGGIAGH